MAESCPAPSATITSGFATAVIAGSRPTAVRRERQLCGIGTDNSQRRRCRESAPMTVRFHEETSVCKVQRRFE
jgi:hypothetical protein